MELPKISQKKKKKTKKQSCGSAETATDLLA